ncbi:MAG: response regulator [SAR324 cluster bacterium]|nr:response regulator [SAR324 cluster bacterium]MCZ6533817.1 response regulator [SAR324 cluster bacterium]MCZ6557535.1 response regulator [SAR324 cluster bacterium]MCZ6629032.1 response regulator [SAR324 cluster bacterium]MCZ6646421.1 response regulator [SAR324 cluster bacterium]
MESDKSIRVLCVEDNPNLRKVLINIIKKIGYSDIVEAEDGVQAWERIEEGGVGLVLTDWSMPRMDGMELLQKIRGGQGAIANLPILMITAADTKSHIMDAAKAGVDAYIIKPFSVATVAEKIEEALSKRSPP